jgi:hypothetical protein
LAYQVRQHPNSTFDADVVRIAGSKDRAKAFVDGVIWVLQRNPYVGHKNCDVWSIPDVNGQYDVYYQIDENAKVVVLLALIER